MPSARSSSNGRRVTDDYGHSPVVLEIIRSRDGGDMVLTVTGELDIATTPDLVHALSAGERSDRVILDLSGLAFIDSTGLGALLEAHNDAVAEKRALVIWRPAPRVRRLFELTGADRRLTVLN